MVTSSDVKFILNIQKRSKPSLDKRAMERERRKKPEGMNRELFNLIGGNPQQAAAGASDISVPLKGIRPGVCLDTKWVFTKFVNPARSDNLELYHWQKETEIDQSYPYAKLNKKVDLVKYTDEEYKTLIDPLDSGWTKEETDRLWDLCERYDLRFIVVQDRFNMGTAQKRSIEELKTRYYSVARMLLENRGDVNHPVVRRPYNAEYELRRKSNLQKFYSRTQESHNLEKQLLDTLKILDQKIKKEEKEVRNLKKILKSDPKPSSEAPVAPQSADENNGEEQVRAGLILTPVNEDQKSDDTEEKKRGGRRDRGSNVYLRSTMLKMAPTIPEKTKKKMLQVMTELEVPKDLIPTVAVIKLYDQLKEKIIELLELEKAIEKKERENKAEAAEEEEKKKQSAAETIAKEPEKSKEAPRNEKEPGKEKENPAEGIPKEPEVGKSPPEAMNDIEAPKQDTAEEAKEGEGEKAARITFAEQPKDSETIAGNLRRERKQKFKNLGSKMLRLEFKYRKEKKEHSKDKNDANTHLKAVSYTHLTLPTICSV
eukprot:TRINITY_DN6005_c0_g3_i1.p1 TRINITY_DN6005_c0_g3~~TRINITY_DN6005_c0_g3_i1.p1  ORF type:complete len:541 (+),score=206.40 TRINITY_DN6005_c0_g3_i1:109-1731(+)